MTPQKEPTSKSRRILIPYAIILPHYRRCPKPYRTRIMFFSFKNNKTSPLVKNGSHPYWPSFFYKSLNLFGGIAIFLDGKWGFDITIKPRNLQTQIRPGGQLRGVRPQGDNKLGFKALKSAPLQDLYIQRNNLSENSKSELKTAWAAAGKPADKLYTGWKWLAVICLIANFSRV